MHNVFNERRFSRRRKSNIGFTLIELLVVISIIGVLAALIIGIYPAAHRKSITSRLHTELNNLAAVIENYKSAKNFYPPDNAKNPTPNLCWPPLAYELVGTTINGATFQTLSGGETIDAMEVKNYFGRDGFANSSSSNSKPEDRKAENFHKNMKEASVGVIPGTAVRVLTVPYKGTNGDFNTFYYNSTNPEHNTESFDLWAVVVINGQTSVIGNWKD